MIFTQFFFNDIDSEDNDIFKIEKDNPNSNTSSIYCPNKECKYDLGLNFDSRVKMIKIVYPKLNVYCYYFNELECNCIHVVGVGINNLVLDKINEYKKQTNQFINQSIVKKNTINQNRKTSELNERKNSILQEFNNLNRRKSLMFEERQNSFFLEAMKKNLSTNIERFHLREIYTNRSNNILTDLDGCFLVQKTEKTQPFNESFKAADCSNVGPTIYVIESKSRFDKIKIDQKIIQICKFQHSLLEYMKVGSLSNNSKKFQQMIKRYKLVDNFRGLDFKLVFSYQFIDKFCIEYLEAINNGTISQSYEDLTFKMFKYNNNYILLTRRFPDLKQANNLHEFRKMYLDIVDSEENCQYFSLNAIDKFIIDYEYLAEYMEYMQSRICIMSRTEISINGNKLHK